MLLFLIIRGRDRCNRRWSKGNISVVKYVWHKFWYLDYYPVIYKHACLYCIWLL